MVEGGVASSCRAADDAMRRQRANDTACGSNQRKPRASLRASSRSSASGGSIETPSSARAGTIGRPNAGLCRDRERLDLQRRRHRLRRRDCREMSSPRRLNVHAMSSRAERRSRLDPASFIAERMRASRLDVVSPGRFMRATGPQTGFGRSAQMSFQSNSCGSSTSPASSNSRSQVSKLKSLKPYGDQRKLVRVEVSVR